MRILFISMLFFMATHANAQDAPMSKKHFWHTTETTAKPENIWAIWTDVANWHTWDTGLKNATLTEPFQLNAKGSILSLENRKSKFKVVAFDRGKSYTFKTNLPLGGLYVKRYLEVKNERTFFTHEVWFSGLTGGIFANMFGEKFKAMLPEVLENIKKMAEKS
jgi:Polyketide cyclase / dehydrase and lipid transport